MGRRFERQEREKNGIKSNLHQNHLLHIFLSFIARPVHPLLIHADEFGILSEISL